MTLFISITKDIKNILTELQEKVIAELYVTYPSADMKQTLPEALAKINENTGNKFIFIIDEWDALFREVKNDVEIQMNYMYLLRSLFKSSLTDKTIEAAYITGILPIKKYGTQSAMTDFIEYTMLQPEPLEQYVGFTEEEVRNLCENGELNFLDIQHCYDGYMIGDLHVYNPLSIMYATNFEEILDYWTRTETYESLKAYIDMDFDGLKEAVVQIIGGAHCRIDVETFQNDMTSMKSKDDVLTLLIHLGYLTYDAKHEEVYIPNEEVRREFVRVVKAGKGATDRNEFKTSI
jgi:hypothetical protein